MNESKKLDTAINIRIPVSLKRTIEEIAESYGLKTTTLARTLLLQHINEYSKNRFWG